jgi:putative transposase
VLAKCKPSHRNQEFVSFLRTIDRTVQADPYIHGSVENYATHFHILWKLHRL